MQYELNNAYFTSQLQWASDTKYSWIGIEINVPSPQDTCLTSALRFHLLVVVWVTYFFERIVSLEYYYILMSVCDFLQPSQKWNSYQSRALSILASGLWGVRCTAVARFVIKATTIFRPHFRALEFIYIYIRNRSSLHAALSFSMVSIPNEVPRHGTWHACHFARFYIEAPLSIHRLQSTSIQNPLPKSPSAFGNLESVIHVKVCANIGLPLVRPCIMKKIPSKSSRGVNSNEWGTDTTTTLRVFCVSYYLKFTPCNNFLADNVILSPSKATCVV